MTPVTLRAGSSTATVSPRGAELRAWSVGDHPLIWEPDPAIWPDTAPILFPVVGWTRGGCIRVGGTAYPLGVHGFARELPFVVAERDGARVRLTLAASPETRRCFPFDWSLDVSYALAAGTSDAGTLDTELVVRNAGDVAMPYACGLHPGFRWPFAGGGPADYAIHFAEPEEPHVPVISPDGLFTARTRPIPLVGTRLPLSPDLMAGEALCLLSARSRSLRFVHASGAAIALATAGFPHLALWSRAPGRFLCLEAWTGHGDRVDADGDLHAKPSMRHLPPGGAGRHRARFSFAAPRQLFRSPGLAGPAKAERNRSFPPSDLPGLQP